MFYAVAGGVMYARIGKTFTERAVCARGAGLRKSLIEYVKSHDDDPFVVELLRRSPHATEGEDIEDLFSKYVEIMSEPETYGGNVEKALLSRILDIKITTLEPREGRYMALTINTSKDPTAPEIFLHFSPRHYDLLLESEDGQKFVFYKPISNTQSTAVDV